MWLYQVETLTINGLLLYYYFIFTFSDSFFQTCKLYICGNKRDLVDKDETCRQVNKNTAREFAIGK